MNISSEQFSDALWRLDAEIEEAEQHLADLKLKRTGAETFLAYMNERGLQVPAPQAKAAATKRAAPQTGLTETVREALDPSGAVQSVDQILEAVTAAGHDLNRDQVRNSLHYLARKGVVVSGKVRGLWRLAPPEGSSDSAAIVSPLEILGRADEVEGAYAS